MKFTNIILATSLLLALTSLRAQVTSVHPTTIVKGTYWGLSKPLRDLPAITHAEFLKMKENAENRELNEGLAFRSYPFAATALPNGPDPAWQNTMGSLKGSKSPVVNFEGQISPYYPPDCNGTAGPSHFMQTINCIYSIYDKTGTLVAGPTNLNLLLEVSPGLTEMTGIRSYFMMNRLTAGW
jgi:hypothetical protein